MQIISKISGRAVPFPKRLQCIYRAHLSISYDQFKPFTHTIPIIPRIAIGPNFVSPTIYRAKLDTHSALSNDNA